MKQKKEELRAELENSIAEVQEVKKKTGRIERLRADLQEHLKQNNFAPRVYALLLEDWE